MVLEEQEKVTLGEVFMEFGFSWFKEEYPEALELRSPVSVYNGAMTVWLMIAQKGIANDSLASSVQYLKQTTKREEVARLIAGSKKLKFDTISNNPGAFSNARQRLPLGKVEEFSDYLSKVVEEEHSDLSMVYGYRFYGIDGSTIRLQSSVAICKEFPRQSNQHGENQPAARVVVAHDLVTGTALRPEIGNILDSEQALSHKMMKRLPKKSLVMGDRNFGVFSVVWAAVQAGVSPLERLTKDIAQRVLGKKEITRDGDHHVEWTPSHRERKGKDLPEDASVTGRLIVITLRVPGRKDERFFFFTTVTDLTPEQVLSIYKRRWFIETDLRSIKGTVNLDMIHAKTPDLVKKEIILGVVAYTLIRTVIARGAKMLNLEPRQISFSRARDFILTIAIRLAKATSVKEIQILLSGFLPGLRQLKHPNRKKHRTEPRVIATGTRREFPRLKGTRNEARQKLILQNLNGGLSD